MKLHKRLLTWIIAMLLILSLLPVQIFASEVPLADELPDITEEVQLTEEEPLTDTPIAEEVLEEEISLQEEEPAGIVLEAEGDISLEVVNNVGMFKPAKTLSLTTDGESGTIHLTMESASMDAVFVG